MTTNAIHLQGLGNVPAIPLVDVRPGDVLVWNFGQTSEVVSLPQVTPKTYQLITRTPAGETNIQRKRGTTLVARCAR